MDRLAILTSTEREVTELYAWGASQKEIADIKFKSLKTINKHLENIYRKTGCTKANELSAWWFCHSFGISFDLSPLKRRIVAICLLLLLLPKELILPADMLRARRTKTETEFRTRRENE